jgi:hypothetical protein
MIGAKTFRLIREDRGALAFALLLMAAVAILPACFDRSTGPTVIVTQDQNHNNNASPAPPSPSPSVSPGATNGVSDVASMAIFVFGYDCAAGVPEPNHSAGVIVAGCREAALTATPKQADGKTDAVLHGNNIAWSVTGDTNALSVREDPANPLFNRKVGVIDPRRAGASVTVTAVLLAPDGKRFEASKTITIG